MIYRSTLSPSLVGLLTCHFTMAARAFDHVWAHAAERYRTEGRVAYHFARGKLRGDPVFRAVFESELLQDGPVLDLGCGGGLMLALLASEHRLFPTTRQRAPRLIGVETRPKAAAIARRALTGEAEIITDDVRLRPLPPARVTLLFDVREVTQRPIDPLGWTVNVFVLVHSLIGQSKHIVLGRWPLRVAA